MSILCACFDKPPDDYPMLEIATRMASVTKCGTLNPEDGRYYSRVAIYFRTFEYPYIGVRRYTEYTYDAESKTCTASTNDEVYDDGYWNGDLPPDEFYDEFTTGMAIGYAEYPPWPDPIEWSGPVLASLYSVYRSGSADTSSGFIKQQAKFRFRFPPPATGYLKFWVKTVFTPADSENETTSTMTPYVWEGEIPHPLLPYNHEDNEIVMEDEEFLLEEPALDGFVSIEISKYSFFPDYEPSDPEPETGVQEHPNGFPNM